MWWFAVIFAVLASLLAFLSLTLEGNTAWQSAAYIGFVFTAGMFMICLVFGALKERGRIVNQASDTGVQQRDVGRP